MFLEAYPQTTALTDGNLAQEYEVIMSNGIAFVCILRYTGRILPSSIDRLNQDLSTTTLCAAEQRLQFVHRSDDNLLVSAAIVSTVADLGEISREPPTNNCQTITD